MATYAGLTKDQTFAIERKALTNAQEEFVLDKFTDKKTMPQKSGNELKFHYWDHIDESGVAILSEGVTPASTDMVRVPVAGSLKDQGAWVPFTDKVMREHENAGEFHKETSNELGYVLGRVLEKDAFNIALNGAGTVLPFTNIDADLKLVRQALRIANAPKFTSIKNGSTKVGTKPVNAGWYGFASINDCDIFRAAADFLSVEDYGYTSDLVPNEIGVIKSLGLRIVETAHINDGSALFLGDGGLGALSLGGKNRIEYIVQDLGSEGSTDALKQRGTSGVKTQTGSVVLRADYVVRLQLTAISANAGGDKTSTVGLNVALDGSISDGSAALWSGGDGHLSFVDATDPLTSVAADEAGQYTIRLTPDAAGSAVDEMVLTVS